MENLHAQHVIVTGAVGGLGPSVVETLLACGASVTATSRRRTALDALRADMRQSDRLHVADADPTDSAGFELLLDAAERATGPLDGLVHCVGGFAGGKIVELTDSTVETLYQSVLRSTIVVTRGVVRRMSQRGRGRIVLVGGLASRSPSPGAALYGSLKAAVAHFAQSVAEECRPVGVQVNVVMPGTMNTRGNRESMKDVDASRWTDPRDVAKAIAGLLGDAGSGVSGALVALPDRMW